MKTILYTIGRPGIVLLFLLLSACGAGKFLNREKTRSTESQAQLSLRETRELDAYRLVNTVSIHDSTEQLYRVIIFPVDTFSFSSQHGFKGKALKMEISGSIKAVRMLSEIRDSAGAKQNDSRDIQMSTGTKRIDSNVKILEKKGLGWGRGLVFMGVVLLVFVGWWVLRK